MTENEDDQGDSQLPPPGDEPTIDHHRYAPPTTIRYFGDYEILEEINTGGMGVVYKARQVSLNRLVALKMIRAGELASEAEVQRFYVEAEAAANLDHPNIVPLYEVGKHGGQHYFSMAYIDGPSLSEVLRDRPPTPRAAAAYVKTIAVAINYAHQQGVLHRDIKPSNVLLDDAGQIRITDFGLAKQIGSDSDLTRESQVLGTPEYMPPEQARGENDTLGPQADVYSMGALLYSLLAGRPPFRAENWMATLRQVIDAEPMAVRMLNSAVDRDLETICHKCLQKSPSRRFPTAQDLAEELGRYLSGKPIISRPVSQTTRLWRWCRRQPLVAGLTAATFVLMATVAVVATSYWLREIQLNRTLQSSLRRESSAHDETARQRIAALDAQQREKEGRLVAERKRYIAAVNLTKAAWDEADLPRMIRLLDGLRPQPGQPDLRGFEWFHFWSLCHTQEREVELPHSVLEFAISPDHKTCVAVGQIYDANQAQATFFEIASGKMLDELQAPNIKFRTVTYHPDGKLLAIAGSADGDASGGIIRSEDAVSKLSIFDASTHKQVHQVTMPGEVRAVRFVPGTTKLSVGLRISDTFGKVMLWDYAKNTTTDALGDVVNHVNDMTVDDEGTLIAVASMNSIASVWDIEKRERSSTLSHDVGSVGAVAFSPSELVIATGGADRTVRLWDLIEGNPAATFEGHASEIESLAFSSDGTMLASSSADHTIRIWDMYRDTQMFVLKGHVGVVDQVAFAEDDSVLISVANDWEAKATAMKVWELSDQYATEPFVLYGSGVQQLTFLPNRSIVATSGNPGVWLRDAITGDVVTVFTSSLKGVSSFAFSDDGQTIAIAERELRKSPPPEPFQYVTLKPMKVKIWNVYGTSEPTTLFELQHADRTRVAFSPDGNQLAVGTCVDSEKATIEIWDLSTRQRIAQFDDIRGAVDELLFTPDGRAVIVASGVLVDDWSTRSELAVCDITTGKRRLMANQEGDGVKELSLTPDGDQLLALVERWETPDQLRTFLNVWDVESGEIKRQIQPPMESVNGLKYSPDGKRIAMTADKPDSRNRKVILLIDSRTGEEIVRLGGGRDRIAWSTDGTLLALGGRDVGFIGQIRVLRSTSRKTEGESAASGQRSQVDAPLARPFNGKVLVPYKPLDFPKVDVSEIQSPKINLPVVPKIDIPNFDFHMPVVPNPVPVPLPKIPQFELPHTTIPQIPEFPTGDPKVAIPR